MSPLFPRPCGQLRGFASTFYNTIQLRADKHMGFNREIKTSGWWWWVMVMVEGGNQL